MDVELAYTMVGIIGAIGGAGGAWGATRQKLKHAEKAIDEIKEDVDKVEAEVIANGKAAISVEARLARIETQLEFLVEVHKGGRI